MKKIFASAAVVLLVAVGVFLIVKNNSNEDNEGKVTVAASYYPLYEFVKHVGGNRVAATSLTPAGVEAHDFEPSARDLAKAHDMDVFVYNGAGFEGWTDSFLHDYHGEVVAAANNIQLAYATDDHHDEDESGSDDDHGHGHEHEDEILDPHFWLDPVLAQQVVDNIRDGLIAADPGNADYYRQNATNYNSQLAQLDQDFAEGLHNCKLDTIVASHNAFSYVAMRYGFEVEAIAGLSHDDEPSPQRLADLADHVKDEGVEYIFFEDLASPRLADTIARETGAQTLVLNPIEGLTHEQKEQGQNYLGLQRQNLANLGTALACQ